MRTLRIVPDLRSSVVEEMPPGQLLLHTSRRTDADADLLAGPAVAPFTWPALVRALDDPDLALLEVAEPLWLAEWVGALRYVVLARVLRALRPERRGVLVATYAIENLDARRTEGIATTAPARGGARLASRGRRPLRHGCRVVTTSETGLADDLRDHPLVVLTPPGDPHALAAGLRHAMRDTVPGPAPARAGHTERDVTAWWLAAR